MRGICAQAWQAEAIEDGRISGAERQSFERHAATCADCRRERQLLAGLRAAAERLPLDEPAPLERRRQRQLLLRRASELSRGSGEPRARWFALAVALAIASGGLVTFSGWVDLERPRAALVAPSAPTYRLSAAPGTEWRSMEQGPTLRLRLDRGELELHVDKLSAAQRFVLELPDGELEVVGTRFVAVATALGTERVSVSEGRVLLRLSRQAPLSLAAGESWDRASEQRALKVAPDAGVRVEPPAESAPSRRAASTAARAQRREAGEPRGASSASAVGVKSGSPASAGADFARAMAAFSAGDYAQAERAFLGFERRHPGDARCEDATFLRAVAHARRGDGAGASAIARQYLERYPEGLRAREAQQLIARE